MGILDLFFKKSNHDLKIWDCVDITIMECPCCKNNITFRNYGGIEVNIECENLVIPNKTNFLQLIESCNNPLCEWSKI